MPNDWINKILNIPTKIGIEKRKSPIGISEYMIPPGILELFGANAISPGVIGGPNMSIYSGKASNNPELMNHERIHQGQATLENYPSEEEIRSIIPKIYGAGNDPVSKALYKYEAPAYEFENPYIAGQDTFNKYIDLIYSMNPGKSQGLEMNMPHYYMKKYTKEHPRPLVNKLPKGLK